MHGSPRFFLPFLSLFFALPALAADPLAKADAAFLQMAAMGGMMEVKMGELAKDHAEAQDVKDFGARMVRDHGKANDGLLELAHKKNATMPAAIAGHHARMIEKMAKLNGGAFDKAYIAGMVKDHKKDVAMFRAKAKTLQDPELKKWAEDTLPTLEDHLKAVQEIAMKLKIK